MAMNNPETSPISSPEPSLAAVDVSYLATTLGIPETDLRTLLTAPTAELANKFAASASAKAQAYDNLDSEKRKDTTGCSQSFPFMRLPPELRLQIYEIVCKDTFDDAVRTGKIPRSGARPRLSHRAALLHHIKTVRAVLQTSRTFRAEGAGIALQIANRNVESTKFSLNQLKGDYKDHKIVHGQLELCPSGCVSGRYRELLQHFYDLCVILNAVRLVKKNVSESRLGDSLESRQEE